MRVFNSVKVLVAAVGILGMATQAQALAITPSTAACDAIPVCLYSSGDDTSQATINGIILPLIAPALEVYKQNVGEAFDTGLDLGDGTNVADYYETSFFDAPDDPSGATITWTGAALDGKFFQNGPLYLLVKGGGPSGNGNGNAPVISPLWFLFEIAVGAGGWNGQDDIDLTGFYPDQGAISHLTLYAPGGPTVVEQCTNCNPVPDGGSATILLGMGLLGLAALRRRMGRI